MSRFGNLELDGQHEDLEQTSALKDQAYYMAEARTAHEMANFEKALRYYSKVLEYDPQLTAAWGGQVRMLIELGEYREAKVWAEKALERFPRDPELLAAKGVALGRLGELNEALAFSDASIEERGESAYVWLARADVLLARKESRANYCLDKAMLIAAGDWFIAWLAARIHMFYEQFSLALKILQQAVQTNPGLFTLWLDLGRCQAAVGMRTPAEISFRQARVLNPDCIQPDQIRERLSGSRLRGFWRRLFSS